MKIEIDGSEVHVATGGRNHVEGKPFIVFLHGSGFSHLSFAQQTRSMAYDGYNVIAADMPGHYLSGGEPLATIEEQAAWSFKLLDALGAKKAVIVGHSQGGLIALEMANNHPNRVEAIVFVATASAIPVNAALVEMADTSHAKAVTAMVDWAHGADAHIHDNLMPGFSNIFLGIEVMEQSDVSALPTDLRACAAYSNGDNAAQSIKCPTLCILADSDKMTPVKAGKALATMLANNELHILKNTGHMVPSERPREMNALMRAFLSSRFA